MSVTGSLPPNWGSALGRGAAAGHRDRSVTRVSGTGGIFAPRLSHLAEIVLPRGVKTELTQSVPRLGPSTMADKCRESG